MADFNLTPQDNKKLTPSEQSLNANEEMFRHAFGYASTGMALVSPDGRLLKVNQTFCELIGYLEEELINLHLREITYPEDVEEDSHLIQQTLEGKRRTYQMEQRYVHKKGCLVWILLDASLVRDSLGKPLYFVSHVQDITARKQAEKKLEESKLRYMSLVRHNPDIICMLDEKGQLISVNLSTVKITGYTKQELLGHSFIPYISPDYWNSSWELFCKAKSGEVGHTEIDFIHKRGHTISIEISYVPIIINDQLNGIYLIGKDITKRKQQEMLIERLHHNNKLILNSVSEGIFGIDEQLGTIFWNDAAERITGYSSPEMLGKNAYQILKHTDTQGIPYSTEKSPLYSSMNEGVYYHVADEVFQRKSGDVFPVELITSPIHENGKIVGAVITFKDITERKRTEEMLLKSEKLSIVGQIAAGVAHEIRNPLTALKGFTQFLQNGAANKQIYYDIMLSELNHIEFIITEMLVLAKPHIIRYQYKELDPILQNVVTLLESQAILNDIQFVIVIDRDIPKVFCEENQLKQMFINLLKNAMESMPNGGQIDIQMHMKDPQHIRILIKDQGVGIPSEVIGRLGEPFFTTKEKGIGLGVMISYKIIEDHQGSINIKSQTGEGTFVEIELPVAKEEI